MGLGEGSSTMSDPFRMYEAARKHMYTAMERESDPPTAIRGYQQALDGFALFLTAAAKNRGMYKELVARLSAHCLGPARNPRSDCRIPVPARRLPAAIAGLEHRAGVWFADRGWRCTAPRHRRKRRIA